MSRWVVKGIRTGIKTTQYPRGPEGAAGVTPGLPVGIEMDSARARSLVNCCPTHALSYVGGRLSVNDSCCVHCYRCARQAGDSLPWRRDFEWATAREDRLAWDRAFESSMHIIVVDAGDCGACLNEVKQLNNPYYDMHRLGFFITPTPRHADLLLVVGPVTDHIRPALLKTYESMPEPKGVVAVGACAVSGGVFADSFVCSAGVSDVLPVDVEVPGHPPPPLAILHGLLVAAGRKEPAAVTPTFTPVSGESE